jgi:hypothetical protein
MGKKGEKGRENGKGKGGRKGEGEMGKGGGRRRRV